MTPNLTLYSIEGQLVELLAYREETWDSLNPEERATVDAEIERYLQAEIQKADNIAAYLRECESRAALLKEEAARIAARGKAWAERGERLKHLVENIMSELGKKRIEGQHSTLTLARSPAAVEIAQPELVPAKYRRITMQVREDVWQELRDAAHASRSASLLGALERLLLTSRMTDPEPQRAVIAADLKANQGVPGCRLREDGVHLVIK